MPRSSEAPLNVIITIDVECWPRVGHALEAGIDREVAHHIYGQTRSGEALGIEWQLDLLDRHGLRGVFFVEALSAVRGCESAVAGVVDRIQARGHDVELHAHTEWFGYLPPDSLIAGKYRQHLAGYSEAEQCRIITMARKALESCGAQNLVAFRAGNFGASRETLSAVRDAGLVVDSSYNPALVGRACAIRVPGVRVTPFLIDGIWEYPVTCFRDKPELRPDHLRPLQLTATSFREMATVLWNAAQRGLHTVIILTHSFEMTHFRAGVIPPRKNRLNVYRFRRLCRFLADHREMFRVTTFKEVISKNLLPAQPAPVGELPESGTLNYLMRGVQNLSSNLLRF